MTQNLEDARKEIDSIDNEIISLLSKRKGLSKKIAQIKKELNKPILDKGREHRIIEKLKASSKEKGLDEDFIAGLYNIILKNSRDEQKNQD